MAGAYYQKIAHIDLKTGAVQVRQLPCEMGREFIGGRGLAAKLLCQAGAAGAEPLSADNVLVFAVGPMTCGAAPAAGRYTVATKSPVSGKLIQASSGGIWGAKLKRAGWDALVVEGEAEEWTCILVEDAMIRLVKARDCLGLMSEKTVEKLRAQYGAEASVLHIGPAGENKVLLSAIMNDTTRAVGRGGMAAVMGAKKLKAIVVKASCEDEIPYADPRALQQTAEELTLRLSRKAASREEKRPLSAAACRNCPLACGRAAGMAGKGGGRDRATLDTWAKLCDDYGLDAIGTLEVLDTAAQLCRQGALDPTLCAELILEQDSAETMARQIGRLADPKTELERWMSAGAACLRQHCGVEETPVAAQKRSVPAGASLEAQALHLKQQQALTAVIDSMGCCLFGASAIELQEYAALLNAATGTDWTAEQLLKLGEGICRLADLFNESALQK